MKRGNGEFILLQDRQRLLLTCGLLLLIAACLAHITKVLFRPEFVLLDIGESIVFAFIVARATQNRSDNLAKFLQWRVLRYIGKISYGIYVYHAFMSPLKDWIWRTYDLPDITQSALNPFILTCMTISTAIISWHLIEKPINRLKRSIPPGPVTAKLQEIRSPASV
jgi:peptidoglycan/LPS O-acetylase OafA/YrhL